MNRHYLRHALLAGLLAFTAACSDEVVSPTVTQPTPTFTDTFTGTLTVNGAATHAFVTQASGTVTALLRVVEPDANVVVGVSLGTWNGVSCQIVIANDKATQGSQVTGAVSSSGSLCLRVYDVGALTAPLTYTVDVVHP
jgi:hypothetical protein